MVYRFGSVVVGLGCWMLACSSRSSSTHTADVPDGGSTGGASGTSNAGGTVGGTAGTQGSSGGMGGSGAGSAGESSSGGSGGTAGGDGGTGGASAGNAGQANGGSSAGGATAGSSGNAGTGGGSGGNGGSAGQGQCPALQPTPGSGCFVTASCTYAGIINGGPGTCTCDGMVGAGWNCGTNKFWGRCEPNIVASAQNCPLAAPLAGSSCGGIAGDCHYCDQSSCPIYTFQTDCQNGQWADGAGSGVSMSEFCCPPTEPSDGSQCAYVGAFCDYGAMQCICQGQAPNSEWVCGQV